MRLLLEQEDMDVNSKDECGYTSLTLAAANGHEAVVRLLLEQEDVDINAQDSNGYTALSWAAWGVHETIMWLLQHHGAGYDPDELMEARSSSM